MGKAEAGQPEVGIGPQDAYHETLIAVSTTSALAGRPLGAALASAGT